MTHLFSFTGQSLTDPFAGGILGAHAEFIVSCILIALLIGIDVLIERNGFDAILPARSTTGRWVVYYLAGAAVIFSGLYGTGAQIFIYFRF
jgi:hypothetical protein